MLDQVVAAYTFSKSYSMSGWRLGYAVTNPEWAAIKRRVVIESDYPAAGEQHPPLCVDLRVRGSRYARAGGSGGPTSVPPHRRRGVVLAGLDVR